MSEFEVKKNVDVKTIKAKLLEIVKDLGSEKQFTATMVMGETYRSITAIHGNQVLCINFMN